jgi:hypothetical protein
MLPTECEALVSARENNMTPAPPVAHSTDVLPDPWKNARASWIPLSGDRAARAKAAEVRKPLLWEYVILGYERGRLAALARDVVDGPAFDFGGRLIAQLRARAAAAPTAGERAQWSHLEAVLSRHLELLPDLLTRIQSLPAAAAR